jgi:hypothetical protein
VKNTFASVKALPYRSLTKQRRPAPLVAYPEFSLPFLTGGQLSILSALSVTRR